MSHDFVQSLKALPQAKVVAVGASALGKAKDFARTHAVAKAYGSYKEVVGDAEVQVVYVGTLHAFHKVRFLWLSSHYTLADAENEEGEGRRRKIPSAEEQFLLFLLYFPPPPTVLLLSLGTRPSSDRGGKTRAGREAHRLHGEGC